MEYNTSRGPLFIREYGRNIQKLVDHACTIQDDEERNKVVKAIIHIMGQLNPHLKNVDDFKHKLWDHIHIISDFKLECESEYPIPDKEELYARPKHIGYPKERIRFKHYGKNVERMVESAKQVEDEEKKAAFAECIGNYMKMAYNSRNRETINDETVIDDLKELSKNELVLEEGTNLNGHAKSFQKKRRHSNNNNRNNNHRRRNHNNNR